LAEAVAAAFAGRAGALLALNQVDEDFAVGHG
jgi:hypothetical protein